MAVQNTSIKKKAREKRRQEAKDKSHSAAAKLRETHKQNEVLKLKLEKAREANKNAEDPNKQVEVEKLQAEIDALRQALQKDEEDAKAAKSAEDAEMLDVKEEEEEEEEEEELVDPFDLGSAGPNGTSDPPVVKVTQPKDDPKPPAKNGDPDAGLFTPENAREASGRFDIGEIAAWKESRYSTPVIIGYGPPNARRYERSTAFAAGIPFDKKETKRFGPDHRFGDEQQGRRYIRQWDEFKGIIGEAYNCDVRELRPKEKGEKRTYPLTELLVKWEIDGKVERVWETRSSIKHLWPNPTECDKYIYVAAQHHADQHAKWLSGQREATLKSPSPAPDMKKLQPKGAPRESEGKREDGNSKPMAAMLEYREEWCALEGIDPTDMTAENKAVFLLTWNMMKSKL